MIGVAVVAAATCVLLTLLLEPDQALAARSSGAEPTVAVLAAPSASPPSPASAPIARRVYPYSIIPGGVADRDELSRVIKTDKVVAAHYASFDVHKAIKLTVGKPRAVHVSYRKGDKVYWTARKLMLAEGETLLSDGRTEMRARCANRISDVPQLPVELNEPTAEELDSVVSVALNSAELGLDDADFAAGGSMNGLGFALASIEPPSGSSVDGASLGGISGSSTARTRAKPVSARSSIAGAEPGNSTSGGTGGTPVVVAPSQGHTGDTGSTQNPTPTPGGKPSTPLPGGPPPAPGGSTTPAPDGTPITPPAPGTFPPPGGEPPTEGPGTPLPPPLSPEPPWPPGDLPEVPGEDVHEVPEPNTLWLSAAAFAAILLRRKVARSQR